MSRQERDAIDAAREATRERLHARATDDEQRALVERNTGTMGGWLKYAAIGYPTMLEKAVEANVTAEAAVVAVAVSLARMESQDFNELDGERRKGYLGRAALAISEVAEAMAPKVPA